MLNSIKILLDIAPDDTDCDKKLEVIMQNVKARLKNLLGGIEPPESMEHIIVEVSVIRFNRIGSEGMSSHSVEGESTAYIDDDFAGFMSLKKIASEGK